MSVLSDTEALAVLSSTDALDSVVGVPCVPKSWRRGSAAVEDEGSLDVSVLLRGEVPEGVCEEASSRSWSLGCPWCVVEAARLMELGGAGRRFVAGLVATQGGTLGCGGSGAGRGSGDGPVALRVLLLLLLLLLLL